MGSNDQPAYRKAGCTLFSCLLTVKSIILPSFCKACIERGETFWSLSHLMSNKRGRKRQPTSVLSEQWRALRTCQVHKVSPQTVGRYMPKNSVWKSSKILVCTCVSPTRPCPKVYTLLLKFALLGISAHHKHLSFSSLRITLQRNY